MRRRIVPAVLAFVVLVGGVTALDAAEPELRLLSDTAVDREALHLPEAIWNTTVNGMAFQQSAIATHNGWQYTTWWDADRRLCIARRELPEGDWEVIRFDDYRIESDDTHNVTTIGICAADGTIHMAFDHHGSPLHYRVSEANAASDPASVDWSADLFSPVKQELQPGEAIAGVTYPRFIPTNDGNLQLMYRSGGSGNGDWLLADYHGGDGWSQPRIVIGRGGDYGLSTSRCAYLHGIAYDDNNRLHLSFVWRETGNPMTNHDIYYAYSDDGGDTWLNNAGDRAGLRGEQPMRIDTPGLRVKRIDMYRGLMNSTTQITDGSGRLHIVNFHLPDEVPSQLDWQQTRQLTKYMHYWRDSGGEWRRNETPFNGGRPQVFADSADNLYFVFTGDRRVPDDRDLVIAAASAEDNWRTWEEIYRIPGPFTGQPQLDRSRGDGVLTIYIQEYPEDPEAPASALRIIELESTTSER